VANSDKRQRQKENARAAREAREAAQKRARRNKAIVRLLVAAVIVAAIAGLVALVSDDDDQGDDTAADTSTSTVADTTTTSFELPDGCVEDAPETPNDAQQYDEPPPMTIDQAKTYTATVSTTCGEFTITLDDDDAPQTVNSFVFLAREGFYDGLEFHRVAKDFVIQGGDPEGNGQGGPGYELPDEPPADGYVAGSVAMANSGSGTTGSQFFVTLTEQGAQGLGGPPYLYSSLGTVTEGLDVVEKLGALGNPDEVPGDISTQVPRMPLYIFSVEITES
jgi:cyclophilin family peptidyl-prolyl cis-trans isomerase